MNEKPKSFPKKTERCEPKNKKKATLSRGILGAFGRRLQDFKTIRFPHQEKRKKDLGSRGHGSGYHLYVLYTFLLLSGTLLIQEGAEGTVGPEYFAARSWGKHFGIGKTLSLSLILKDE